jgi:hypothetical protein
MGYRFRTTTTTHPRPVHPSTSFFFFLRKKKRLLPLSLFSLSLLHARKHTHTHTYTHIPRTHAYARSKKGYPLRFWLCPATCDVMSHVGSGDGRFRVGVGVIFPFTETTPATDDAESPVLLWAIHFIRLIVSSSSVCVCVCVCVCVVSCRVVSCRVVCVCVLQGGLRVLFIFCE